MISAGHRTILILLAAGVAGALGACAGLSPEQKVHQISQTPAKPAERVAQQRTVLPPGQPAPSQATFPTADEAVRALVMACTSKDHGDLQKIFGPAAKDFVSGDPVEDENDFNAFAAATADRAALEEKSPNAAVLHIGKEDWAFPIPIVKTNAGQWYFDTLAGETEILARRIGSNEFEAIALCRAYVDAQREYAAQSHDGNEVLQYAQRLMSSPGKHDGLYWPAENGGVGGSRFGPLVADASAEGYAPISGSRRAPTPYHGYYFHVIKAQGPHAPGGAYDYVINGNMIAGFALVAYPAEYGKSGVMTFIVSHQGKVFQKDLGANTMETAQGMARYDPDGSWALVKD